MQAACCLALCAVAGCYMPELSVQTKACVAAMHHTLPAAYLRCSETPASESTWLQINPVAVYGILDTVQIPPGKYLLQSAAGSAVGRMLIALAKVRQLTIGKTKAS